MNNPQPPFNAKFIDILLSVTVSMAAEIIGICNFIFPIDIEVITSLGFIIEKPGESKTSSKVIEYLELHTI